MIKYKPISLSDLEAEIARLRADGTVSPALLAVMTKALEDLAADLQRSGPSNSHAPKVAK